MRPYGCRGEAVPPTGPLAPDLVRATTFAHGSAERLRATGAGELPGEFYPRYGHPAGRRFESLVAEAEGADGAVAFASGMAAIHALFLAFLRSGERLALSRDVYGGVASVAREDLPRFSIGVVRFDPFRPDDAEKALRSGARILHVESPTNPLCRVLDLRGIADLAHRHGALATVDATFLPAPLQRPLELGFDLVMHSATKFFGGHHDALGGVVSGRHELLRTLESYRRRSGAILSPDTAWLFVRSMATLELRARAACDNAARVAARLEELRSGGSRVVKVHHPSLPGHPDHALALRQGKAFPAIVSFEVEGGLEGAIRVYDRFERIARAVSLGGVETLASLPLHTSHAPVSREERAASGIEDGLIRLSVGIEPYEEIVRDLEKSLQ